jgi:hypothetical protein
MGGMRKLPSIGRLVLVAMMAHTACYVLKDGVDSTLEKSSDQTLQDYLSNRRVSFSYEF